MPTPSERRDLGKAWNHLDKAIEEAREFGTTDNGAKLRTMQEISDARRIIDRVRDGRAHGMTKDGPEQIRAIHRMLVKRVPLRGDQEMLKELAMNIHQALADAAAGRDEAAGVTTLCGPEDQ